MFGDVGLEKPQDSVSRAQSDFGEHWEDWNASRTMDSRGPHEVSDGDKDCQEFDKIPLVLHSGK